MARQLDEEKRLRIIQAAGRAFGAEGFEKTTIKRIARETGVAQGTVYTYFRSKEELFDAVVGRIWHGFVDGLQKINLSSASLVHKFTEFLDFGFELLAEIHPLLRGMYTEANRRELLAEKLDEICCYIDELFVSKNNRPLLFGDISDRSRRFNLNIMISGILFRTSLTKPEDLSMEIQNLKLGILKALMDRMALKPPGRDGSEEV